MRTLAPAAVVSFAILAMAFVLTVGCDQLNRPLGSPSSSSSSSGSSATTNADGGDTGEGGVLMPAITAQPGDIQL